jgi:hypothetical protein
MVLRTRIWRLVLILAELARRASDKPGFDFRPSASELSRMLRTVSIEVRIARRTDFYRCDSRAGDL